MTLQPGPSRRAPSRPARGAVLGAAMLTIMAPAIISPSLPAMREVFAGTPGADLLVRFALTVTSLAIAVSAPLSGLVADRLGRRPLLVTSLVLYAVSGTAGFFVTDLYLLLATRALLGVAVGGIRRRSAPRSPTGSTGRGVRPSSGCSRPSQAWAVSSSCRWPGCWPRSAGGRRSGSTSPRSASPCSPPGPCAGNRRSSAPRRPASHLLGGPG